MAKKKAEVAAKIEESAAPETAKLVSVEMTQDQLDEFVKFKAKQEEDAALASDAAPEEKPRQRMVLTYEHRINGNKYGPGPADVRSEHVGLVTCGEQRRIRAELRLNTSRATIKNLGTVSL